LSSTTLAAAPPASARTTFRTIIVVVTILVVAIWAAVAFSLATSRQAALDAISSEGHNLMIAFREEVAVILRGLDGGMYEIAKKMRREHGDFDLYGWGPGEHADFLGDGASQHHRPRWKA
jgi:hypothetical protein